MPTLTSLPSSSALHSLGHAEATRMVASMMRDPLAAYVRLMGRYGDAVHLPISNPGNGFYLLSRPEHAEHVLVTNQDNYVKAATYRPLKALIGDGLLTSEGRQWRRHRRVIQPHFSRRHITSYAPMMADAARRLTDRWDRLADGTVLDVCAQMSAVSLDVAGHALFGTDLTSEVEEMYRAMSAGQRVTVMATFVPLRWGPASGRMVRFAARRLGRNGEGIEGPVGRIIAGRAAAGVPDGPPRDMLDALLQSRDDQGARLTSTEVADEVATFLLAGYETSSNALAWSLALLSAYPAARERLEAEADSVLSGRPPQAEDAAKLVWARAVVCEALRLYPPAWTIERDALADDNVAGVAVPKGSLIAISPYLVHRHREFWPDPTGFDPRRFLPAHDGDLPAGTQAGTRHRYAYIPFGAGRRACIGSAFAELETVLVLAAIASRFRLEATMDGFPKPVAQVTLRPRGLRMRFSHR